ncbi:MAG: hypothetical protein VYE53_12200 [Planctomycetota bacterium]|nr:hypothetical protein [Planctomycetota bacterium]
MKELLSNRNSVDDEPVFPKPLVDSENDASCIDEHPKGDSYTNGRRVNRPKYRWLVDEADGDSWNDPIL